MEENPTRLCMPSHWTGETDSPEVELSKRDRSNAPSILTNKGADYTTPKSSFKTTGRTSALRLDSHALAPRAQSLACCPLKVKFLACES